MLISVSEYINSGLPVSTDISEYEIENAIKTVEHFYVKNRIGDANYIDLETPSATNYILLNGGTIDDKVFAGLKMAMYHLVYAYMIINNIRQTRYSSVEKTSDFSKNSEKNDIWTLARTHWDMGMAFCAEIEEYYGLDSSRNQNNNIFETILY